MYLIRRRGKAYVRPERPGQGGARRVRWRRDGGRQPGVAQPVRRARAAAVPRRAGAGARHARAARARRRRAQAPRACTRTRTARLRATEPAGTAGP